MLLRLLVEELEKRFERKDRKEVIRLGQGRNQIPNCYLLSILSLDFWVFIIP
jgi:hypothetical protein